MNQRQAPVLGLRIGIVGNRDLSGVDINAVKQALNTLLTQLCSGVEAIGQAHNSHSETPLYADDSPRFFLINSLAEGADQLAAEVAVELPFDFKLRCPIAFTVDAYKQSFSQAKDQETFDRLIADERLDAVVIEMHCDEESPKIGYRAAADRLLDNTDILIALYDPDGEDVIGGSIDSVNSALQRRIPVLHINTQQINSVRLYREADRQTNDGVSVTNVVINNLLNSMLLPVESTQNKTSVSNKQQTAPVQYKEVMCFYSEALLQNSGFNRLFIRTLYVLYAPAWWVLYTILKCCSFFIKDDLQTTTENVENQLSQHDDNAFIAALQKPYQQQKLTFDSLATFYMNIYRGSFICNFTLGAVAVFLAVMSFFGNQSPVWSIAEIACLLVILFTYLLCRAQDWKKKAVDYRYLAEYFRHIEMLASLGRNAPLLQPAAHYSMHDPGNTWMGWYLNAFMRSIGPYSVLPNAQDLNRHKVSLDNQFVGTVQQIMSKQWLEDQLRYHHVLAKRYLIWEKMSNTVMSFLFVLTVLGVLLHMFHINPLNIVNTDRYELLIALTITALPAFLAAIHGIAVQGEIERLAERSEATADYLSEIIKQFNHLDPDQTNYNAETVGDHAVHAAQIMLEEVTDWQILYRAHSVQLT